MPSLNSLHILTMSRFIFGDQMYWVASNIASWPMCDRCSLVRTALRRHAGIAMRSWMMMQPSTMNAELQNVFI